MSGKVGVPNLKIWESQKKLTPKSKNLGPHRLVTPKYKEDTKGGYHNEKKNFNSC